MHSDIFYVLEILFMLFGILVSCQVFTNAIENLGEKLNLGHEFTGSVLAAVGTALPETILPLVAIFLASQNVETAGAKHDIAIGAIVGAPFMLATLAMFLLGLSIIVHKKQRKKAFNKSQANPDFLKVNIPHLKRDLKYFLITFSFGIAVAAYEPLHRISHFIAYGLILVYFFYIYDTYNHTADEIPPDEEDETEVPTLYLKKFIKVKNNLPSIVAQTVIGLMGIVYFANHFIQDVEHIAGVIGVSPLILSLIVSPIATELPEKINTWLWSAEGKDTLAIGNVTGAMVFQAAIPCFIGIMLTPWHLDRLSLICASLAIISTLILYIKISVTGRLGYKTLLTTGSLYLVYLVLIFV